MKLKQCGSYDLAQIIQVIIGWYQTDPLVHAKTETCTQCEAESIKPQLWDRRVKTTPDSEINKPAHA